MPGRSDRACGAAVGVALSVIAVALTLALARAPLASAQEGAPVEALDTGTQVDAVVGSIDLPTGRFFAAGIDELGLYGHAVVDEPGGAPLWTSYTRLGGSDALGTPVSRPFALPDAHVYQAFEYGVLRWRPGLEAAELAETLDLMWAAGRDDWLAEHGVPRTAETGGDPRQRAVIALLTWTTNAPLRDAYLAAASPANDTGLPAALLRYGLPASPPEHDAAGVTQRFDRAALRWDAETDSVLALPVGRLLAESGLLDARTLAPDRLVGGTLVARAPRPLLNWPNARGWGVPEVTDAPTTATTAGGGLSEAATGGGPPRSAPTIPATATTPREAPTASPTQTPPLTSGSPIASTTPRPASPMAGASLSIKAVVNEGRAEHAVVANDGTAPQELTGWVLRSGTGGQQLPFPAGFVLQPGATVRVHSGSGASTQNRPPTDLFATSQNVWNNQGDSALLVDPTGRVVSQLTYGG